MGPLLLLIIKIFNKFFLSLKLFYNFSSSKLIIYPRIRIKIETKFRNRIQRMIWTQNIDLRYLKGLIEIGGQRQVETSLHVT